MTGSIVAIFIAPTTGSPTASHDEVKAVAGRGLEGDRYFDANAADHDPEDEITLIEAEGLELAASDRGVVLEPGEHRRNVVTRGVDLLSLVGQTVKVGDAEVELVRDNPPCKYLQELTGKQVLRALQGRGGARGRIVSGGVIRVGDPVAATD
jgi:MOSC domain-containing protein YiiM